MLKYFKKYIKTNLRVVSVAPSIVPALNNDLYSRITELLKIHFLTGTCVY